MDNRRMASKKPLPSQVTSKRGIVYLVGAGPGDPGLVTVKGRSYLERCDALVYDKLANPILIDLASPEADRFYVGKSSGRHTLSQDEINQLLVKLASEGKTVVRLKGGDPFIFGRGGEEAEALVEAGLDFEVIPGVTAAIAAAAYAGIPVTHRSAASTFVLVTGHEDPTKDESAIDFQALSRMDSIAFYMGVKNLAANVQRLLDAGMDPQTPTAMVRRGTHPDQRTVISTLGTIAEDAAEAGIGPPAITIIGNVVSYRENLRWFDKKPLFGKTVIVTRTRRQASDLSRRLSELGAHVIESPTIAIEPAKSYEETDDALANIGRYDWLALTSENGVNAMIDRLKALGKDGRALAGVRIAAIGPTTAEALRKNFLEPDCLPDEFVAEALARTLKDKLGDLSGARFLLLRADIARPALRVALKSSGAEVDDIAIYRTVRPRDLPDGVRKALAEDDVDWITFTSSSTVNNLVDLVGKELLSRLKESKRIRFASIGPITTEALANHGLSPDVQADPYTIPGLVDALCAKAIDSDGGR
jgi:uroporphyrinogen III methyltransferase/synthase